MYCETLLRREGFAAVDAFGSHGKGRGRPFPLELGLEQHHASTAGGMDAERPAVPPVELRLGSNGSKSDRRAGGEPLAKWRRGASPRQIFLVILLLRVLLLRGVRVLRVGPGH
jgi:hypothetical protein